MGIAAEVLRKQWHDSGDRLHRRLKDLSDAEMFWEPVSSCWTVRQDPARPGRWEIDYDWPPPQPPPFTTIAWRLVHVANGNWIYWEHAFGPGRRTFADLEVPSTAEGALALWQASRRPISTWLAAASDDQLLERRPSHLGEEKTAGEVVRVLLDEQTHHGAEVALLRDLYLRQEVGRQPSRRRDTGPRLA